MPKLARRWVPLWRDIILIYFGLLAWCTLNLTLRNICAVKNTEANEITYEECNWIIDISGDVIIIKNFLMNHSMRLAMFNEHVNMKLLLSRRQNLHR